MNDLRNLARAVMAGDLAALVPLADLLQETGDRRLADLMTLAASLDRAASCIPGRVKKMQEEPPGDTSATAADVEAVGEFYRFHEWENFATNFRRLFWLEVTGRTLFDLAAQLTAALDPARQSERLAHCESNGLDLPADLARVRHLAMRGFWSVPDGGGDFGDAAEDQSGGGLTDADVAAAESLAGYIPEED